MSVKDWNLEEWISSNRVAGARVYLVDNLEVEFMPMSMYRPGFFLVKQQRWDELKKQYPFIGMYEVKQ